MKHFYPCFALLLLLCSCSTKDPSTGNPDSLLIMAADSQATPGGSDDSIAKAGIRNLIHEQSYEDSLPSELEPFVLPGYQVREFLEADLNLDGHQDYLLLLSLPFSEDEEANNGSRPLLILTRDNHNRLSLAARNDEVVDGCQSCGAQFGDYFDGMDTDSLGGFSIYHLGGMAWRSRTTVTFRYAPEEKHWLLTEESSYYYNSGMSEGDTLFDGQIYMPVETIRTTHDFGRVLFSEYQNSLF